jgi:mono/diheme cytochrome c family protein
MKGRTKSLLAAVGSTVAIATLLAFGQASTHADVAPVGTVARAAGSSIASGPAGAVAALAAASSTAPNVAGAEALALGKRTFEKQCASCHGLDGRGQGDAAYLLYPKPRDFVTAKYALVSTWERNPTDQDLFDTITRGMPGSAMPSWAQLSEATRWALVQYVKSFAEQPWPAPGGASPPEAEGARTGVIEIPREPPYDGAARARVRELFAEACAACHGTTGRGDGVTEQVDDLGYPTRPRDLTLGVFKGNPDPEPLYRRIIAGMPGTPMPMSDWAYGDDAWHIVHFLRSLSSDEQRARVEMKKFRIPAPRVATLPEHPDSSLWNLASPVNLHLMPLWWRAVRPEELSVQALHDGASLALMIAWTDDTWDHTAIRAQDFRDGAAVEFSLSPEPPFFAMGAKGEFVNIWMWKSEKEADLEPAFQDLDLVYPNIGIDSYPNMSRSALEQPTRRALTLASDPTFITGWGAGNITSDPKHRTSSEDLHSQGFGTLRARPGTGGFLDSTGVYGHGTYRVMFQRALKGEGVDAVTLSPGTTVPVAFAVWNGSAGDRDGKKSVTIWQELQLAP